MKKAQILSAIALAFALGVVVPVAGASAKISNNVAGEDVTAKETIKKMNEAIEAGKESCGYRLNTQTDTKEWLYDWFTDLSYSLDQAAQAVDGVKESQAQWLAGNGATATGYKDAIDTLSTALVAASWNGATATNIDDVLETIVDLDASNIDDTDYAAVKAFVQKNVQALKNAAVRYSSNAAATTAFNAAISTLNGDIETTATNIEGEENKQAAILEGKIAAIKDTDARNKVAYATVVKEANALSISSNGTCSVAKAENLEKAIEYAQSMLSSSWDFTSADGEKAIANITKAMNGGVISDNDTPNIPDSQDPSIKPGNTGVVAGAEGTASTTVSIVAGLATALTALGAGVVVYRNARRSSEN